MFKNLKYKSDTYHRKTYTIDYVFEIIDTDFTCDTSIMVSATDGTEANSIATGSVIQEYTARKLPIAKNLAQWYINRMSDYKERVLDLMDKDKKFIDKYFPGLKYNKALYDETYKIVEKKVKEFNEPKV
jgi:hypothetical protein